MLIVLTSEQVISNEAQLINQLFASGLEILHLRKPGFTIDAYRTLLNGIQDQFHGKIMIHHYHELLNEYALRGIHIQEQPRIDLGADLNKYVSQYENLGAKVSSSFHDPDVLASQSIVFDYHLLSPVFSSISKQGYEGKGFSVHHIDKKIIGMGGINEKTIPDALRLGYSGIGVLGGVWNTADPVSSFNSIKSSYQTV